MATKKAKKKKYVFPMDVVRLVRKVEKKILEEPRRFDMAIVAEKTDMVKLEKRLKAGEVEKEEIKDVPPCGTTACIAGWIGLIELGDKVTWKRGAFSDFADKEAKTNLWSYARKRLGIPESLDGWNYETKEPIPDQERMVDAQRLFLASDWPLPYRDRFDEAETPRQRARVAVQRLEFMLKTGR